MDKTMKQIADELGIDKQRVYRFIKKNHINEAHQKNGVKYFNDVVQMQIKQAFSHDEAHQNHINDAHQNHINEAVFEALLKQSEMFKNELEAKNEQIAQLQKLLDQQQQLTAQVQKKIELLEDKKEEEPKKHWWSKK